MTQPFNDIAPQYDLLNDLLSLGLHRVWKRGLVSEILSLIPHPERVLDVSTGTGDVAALFAEKIAPEAISALDPSLPMIEIGQKKFPFLKNWIQGRAEELPFDDDELAIITCTFGVRNFQNRTKAFQEMARVLKPGGLLGILEIHPISKKPAYFPLRLLWDHVVPALGGIFQKRRAYQYLRDTGAGFISSEDMVEELAQDFNVKMKRNLIPGGLVSFLVFEKK